MLSDGLLITDNFVFNNDANVIKVDHFWNQNNNQIWWPRKAIQSYAVEYSGAGIYCFVIKSDYT